MCSALFILFCFLVQWRLNFWLLVIVVEWWSLLTISSHGFYVSLSQDFHASFFLACVVCEASIINFCADVFRLFAFSQFGITFAIVVGLLFPQTVRIPSRDILPSSCAFDGAAHSPSLLMVSMSLWCEIAIRYVNAVFVSMNHVR